MNFLAHLYLSNDNPRVMVGNFLGDFVKGKDTIKTFDPVIASGIELHRGIDMFTDHHPVVQQSKNRLRPKYRHYSGVIVDMFYDYYLGTSWGRWHTSPLPEFAAFAYEQLKKYEPIMPEDARRMLPYLIRGNWLEGYATQEGIHQALSGMARRTVHDSKMDEAIDDLKHFDEAFKSEFEAFFPELKSFAEAKLNA